MYKKIYLYIYDTCAWTLNLIWKHIWGNLGVQSDVAKSIRFTYACYTISHFEFVFDATFANQQIIEFHCSTHVAPGVRFAYTCYTIRNHWSPLSPNDFSYFSNWTATEHTHDHCPTLEYAVQHARTVRKHACWLKWHPDCFVIAFGVWFRVHAQVSLLDWFLLFLNVLKCS